ncbi:hypothetical protein [Poritiphilus flavus]|uniref:Lipoprotein n=1 Tax=Poritiphilus flavus TaxID=2697053 RepID=A0A6L9E8G4_9FLAO|nr:hypothetical protein [Poritiphilus flavus]NAS10934.1 hypothetical protein [Poritiphilus flavus]
MRYSIYILFSLVMGLGGCSSQKKLETSTPFVLGPTICQDWIGGRAESGSGRVLRIAVREMPDEGISLQNVYFRGHMAKIDMVMEDNGMIALAKYELKSEKPDMIMHADSTKEVGNQPPKLKSKEFPFDLQKDEAVLSYLQDDKIKYVKISGVVDKPARVYKGRPKN